MSKSKNNINKPNIIINKKKYSFNPESKAYVDIEILILNITLFGIIALFSLDYISWPIFLLLFYSIAMRIFIGVHDRMHASLNSRLPLIAERIIEGIAVVVTPWDEPYESIKNKHIAHHRKHHNHDDLTKGNKIDPHSIYEKGGIIKVLISCLFYEEMQLFLDIKMRSISSSRIYRTLIYVPLIVLFIIYFGWIKYLFVLLAMRIVGFTAWFVFSWVIHHPAIYKFGFADKMPMWFRLLFSILHGNRVTQGCLHHATHHAWPSIPFDQLYKFDAIARTSFIADGH